MFTNKKKIALVGTGMVGMSFAYAALNQNLCDELVLIDINEQRARGEAMDLNHGIAFSPASTKIYAGNYSDCKDADIVVICSSDDEYAEYAIPAFKAVNGRAMFIVAGAPACMEELKAAGIENFIHVRCNVLETLKEYNEKLGIKIVPS